MAPKYTITIRNRRGIPRTELLDFQTLKIIDSVNSVGSWTLTSTTRGNEPQPFQPGDGIIVKRDGVVIYSGVMQKVESSYNPTMKAWTWSASGINDLAFCKWHYVRPDDNVETIEGAGLWDNPQTLHWLNWYWTDTPASSDAQGRPIYILAALRLINDQLPLTVDDLSTLSQLRGYEIVGSTETWFSSPPKLIVRTIDISLRYENLLDVILFLAEKGEFYITTRWDETDNKVHYVLNEGIDRTNTIVFSFDNGAMQSLKYVMQAPDTTEVFATFNSLLNHVDTSGTHTPQSWNYTDMYHYESTYQMIRTQEPLGETGWHRREKALYPDKEYFCVSKEPDTYQFTWEMLQNYAVREGQKYVIGPDHGYEIGLNLSGTTPVYMRDFILGDLVTVELPDGTQTEERIVGININVSYGKESITAVMGSKTGSFNAIYKDIEEINKTLRRAEEGEIK